MPGSRLLAGVRMLAYAAATVALTPLQMALLTLESPLRQRVPLAYHRLCRRIFGMRVVVTGVMSRARPTLFVSNHHSYLDITVLGSLIHGSFVAKSDVAGWPVFGWLARLQRTVFVDRHQRSAAASQENLIRQRLMAGDSLILFPEGTSSDGNRTLRFKSALFKVAELTIDGRPLTVQPVSIAYTRLDGIPIGRAWRPFFAWYGDMDLAPHLWRMASLGSVTVAVHFHAPVTIAEYGSRKALASYAEDRVAAGVAGLLSGRNDALPGGARPDEAPAADLRAPEIPTRDGGQTVAETA